MDSIDGDSGTPQPHHLKTSSKPNLDLGSIVYLLGYTEKKEITVGEGKIVIATDNLIKLSTDGITWSPGSAGFDFQGNLSFMICDPMKLATSPNTNTKSFSTSSSSSTSWKKDTPMQFGIPLPIICDWLNQHWEGSLDELTKPKLPLIRLMSTGQKSEHSCTSFTMRRVFKSTEDDNDGTTPSSSNVISKPRDQPKPGCSSANVNTVEEETLSTELHAATHVQGIPTPEIYESPKFTSVPIKKKESNQLQLLDINFPPRVTKSAVLLQPIRRLSLNSDENYVNEIPPTKEKEQVENQERAVHDEEAEKAEVSSTGSVNGALSEVQSSSSPVEVSEMNHEYYSSEGETTMYSAETAESRNYTSPREGKFQQVGRSQSCVGYNRWGAGQRNPNAQRSYGQGRKMYSQGATSQRSNDFFSPTVSSIMKKRNSSEQQQPSRPRNVSVEKPNRSRQSAVHSSPRWAF